VVVQILLEKEYGNTYPKTCSEAHSRATFRTRRWVRGRFQDRLLVSAQVKKHWFALVRRSHHVPGQGVAIGSTPGSDIGRLVNLNSGGFLIVSSKFKTDRDLIISCRRGDQEAWEALMERYERLVFTIARRQGLSAEDAADVTQTVFTILLTSLDRLSDDSRLGAWLTTVTRRHTWRALRKLGREPLGEKEDVAEAVVLLGQQKEDPVDRWELLQVVNDALQQLSERCRRLLQALYFDPEEPTYAQVSKQLGIPIGSIGPTRARCLKRLKEILTH